MKRKRRRILLTTVCLLAAVGTYLYATGVGRRTNDGDTDEVTLATPPSTPAPDPGTNPLPNIPSPALTPEPIVVPTPVVALSPPPAPTPAPTPTRTPEAVVRDAELLTGQGKAYEAAGLLSELIVSGRVSGPQRQRVLATLDGLSAKLYFSPVPMPDAETYVVAHGDLLLNIAKPYKITPEYIMRVNRIRDARRVRVSQRLKCVHGPFSARVDLSDFELIVLHKGRYVKRYPIGIGKEQSTPTGTFTVKDKLTNPTFYDSVNGEVIHADNPNNPLGERWIGIGDGYGIHGTIKPDSVGKAESRGCLRLREQDINEVYNLLVIGSTVVVRP